MVLFLTTSRSPEKKRRDIIIKRGFHVTILTTLPDNSILIKGICPSCETKIGYYSHGEKRSHICTVCSEEVYL